MKTTQPEPTTAAELEAALSGYIGTEHYFISPTFGIRGLRYTDGIRAMAELAGAYWLLDTIHAAAMDNPQFKSGFWAVRMESQDNKGRLLITFDFQDDGTPIDATDFVYTMQQQLDPLFQNMRASTYYNNIQVKNARNYVYQGQADFFDNSGLGYTYDDLALVDGVYTLGGAECYIALESPLDWLGGNSLWAEGHGGAGESGGRPESRKSAGKGQKKGNRRK